MASLSSLLRSRATVPFVAFFALFAALVVSLRSADKPPHLDTISPEIGQPGGVLVLKGRYFGDERAGGVVTIAGKRPTSSSYLEWSDNRISVQIPDETGSGMVYVTTAYGVSKGILFTNRNHIPVVLTETARPGEPYIEMIEPTRGPFGTLVTVSGLNFGLTRGTANVLFTPIVSVADASTQPDPAGSWLPASEIDFDYESWTDQSIRVRVPDGATSGNIKVVTHRGESNALYFEVSDQVGTKILRRRQGYQIVYSVEIGQVQVDAAVGTIDIWMPGVLRLPEQQRIESVKVPQPLWEDFLGLSRYQFSVSDSDDRFLANHTFWFDRYEVETKITVDRVPAAYDTTKRVYRSYTQPDALVPSDVPVVTAAARSAVGRERNPYQKARAIYLFLLKQLAYTPQAGPDVLANFSSSTADAYTYAVLFCAMTRAEGIPSRPVAGLLVYGDRQTMPHYWAEFYVERFGWVPVDLALGDNAEIPGLPPVDNPTEYYFGSLGNQHITFTKGLTPVRPLSPHSRTTMRSGLYSLQAIHEEASPAVQSYEARWGRVQVIDLW